MDTELLFCYSQTVFSSRSRSASWGCCCAQLLWLLTS